MTDKSDTYIMQRAKILDVMKVCGKRTASGISGLTGVSAYDVRQHCDEMRDNGQISYNWLTGEYSV